MIPDREEVLLSMRERLTEKQLGHCLRTEETAVSLAERFGVDREKASLAGLLHDLAKNLTGEALLKEAAGRGWSVTPEEEKAPYLIHARLSAALAKEEFGVSDRELLDAIETHTLGSAAMTALQKLIYVADKIEPEREYPGVEEARSLAQKDLDSALCLLVAGTLKGLVDSRRSIHPLSVEVWNSCLGSAQAKESRQR